MLHNYLTKAIGKKLYFLLSFLLICIIFPMVMNAQVEWKDRYITLASGDQKNPSIAKAAQDNYTVVVWEDYRYGQSDIYAMMFDNAHGIASWSTLDGLPVCTAQGEQRNPRAAYDGLGGVIVVWEDYRNDPMFLIPEIFAHRIIIQTGQIDQNWTPDGNPVCTGTGEIAIRPRIVGTEDGAFITWTDYRRGNPIVYLQYILSATGQWPQGGLNVWIQNGIQVSNFYPIPTKNSELVLDHVLPPGKPKSGVIISYDARAEVWQIFATDINAYGNARWRDVQVAPYYYVQQKSCIEYIGGAEPGVVIAWEDKRNTNNMIPDIYAQRVGIGGNIYWGSGVPICTEVEDQFEPKVAVSGGYAVIAWIDERDSVNTEKDIYANRLDLTSGTVYTPQGTPICTAPHNQWHHCLEIVDGTAIIGWEDWRQSPSNIYFQEVNVGSWTLLRQTNGWPATLAKGNQTYPDVGKKVFVFEDLRRVDINLYAQKIGGECSPLNGMQWQDVFAKWTPNTTAMNHRFVTDGFGYKYVVWMEDRVVSQSGIEGPEIYAQKFDKDGVPMWLNDGILVSNPNAASDHPDICVGPGYGTWIVWRQITPGAGGPEIRLMKIDGTGALVPYNNIFNGEEPRIVEDDANNAWVTYVSLDRLTLNIVRTLPIPITYTYTAITPPLNIPMISKDRMNSCWVIVTEGNSYTIAKPGIPPAIRTVVGTAGQVVDYDICTDLVPDMTSPPAEPYNAMVGLSLATGNIQYERYWINPNGSPALVASNLISNNAVGDISSATTICADGIPGGMNGRGGSLVAWQSRVALTGFTKIQAQSIDAVDVIRWLNPLDRNMSMGPWNSEFPDVAKMSGTVVTPSTYVMLTWKDTRFISCGGISNIFVQLLDVLAPPPAHKMWTPNGRALNPSMAAQQEPMIQESSEYTGSIFWIDTRTGSRCVVGTRIHADASGTLVKHIDSDPNKFSSQLKEFALEQNYPNPFGGATLTGNTITTIIFNIPRDNNVKIELYNLFGQMVRVLVDQQLVFGSYSYTLDGTNLPAGIYFYRLTYENSSEIRKMTLLK